jgi:hypothetical protein
VPPASSPTAGPDPASPEPLARPGTGASPLATGEPGRRTAAGAPPTMAAALRRHWRPGSEHRPAQIPRGS